MLRHVPQPFHAGGLEADATRAIPALALRAAGSLAGVQIRSRRICGIEAAGDGAVDDGLLLLLQQLDQPLLGPDVAPDPPVRVVEEADDAGLFGERWEDHTQIEKITWAKRRTNSGSKLVVDPTLIEIKVLLEEETNIYG